MGIELYKANQESGPAVWSGVGITNGSGVLTITFPTPFDSAPAVTASPLTDSANLITVHIHSVLTTAVVIHALQNSAITLLGIQLLAFQTNAAGLEVHVHAVERGNYA